MPLNRLLVHTTNTQIWFTRQGFFFIYNDMYTHLAIEFITQDFYALDQNHRFMFISFISLASIAASKLFFIYPV